MWAVAWSTGYPSYQKSPYRAGPGEKAICPLEMQAGIVDGYWTALAARQGVWVMAQLPPGEGEALFGELGTMSPSKSALGHRPIIGVSGVSVQSYL